LQGFSRQKGGGQEANALSARGGAHEKNGRVGRWGEESSLEKGKGGEREGGLEREKKKRGGVRSTFYAKSKLNGTREKGRDGRRNQGSGLMRGKKGQKGVVLLNGRDSRRWKKRARVAGVNAGEEALIKRKRRRPKKRSPRSRKITIPRASRKEGGNGAKAPAREGGDCQKEETKEF